MHVRLIVDGELSKAFEYNSGVKQGCKLTATLYGIYAAVLLNLACKSIKHKCGSVQVRFRNDGVFFLSYADCKPRLKYSQHTSVKHSMLMISLYSLIQL